MVNPTIASTRSGGPIAAGSATIRHLGDDGHARRAATTWQAMRGLATAVSSVDGLRLPVEPESTVVVFTYDDRALDLFVLADELADRGWRRPERSARAIGPAPLGPELVEVVSALAPKSSRQRPSRPSPWDSAS